MILYMNKKKRRNSYVLIHPESLPLDKRVSIVSAVTIQTPPLLSKSGQCKKAKSTAFAALISIRIHGRSYIDARFGWLNVGSR